MELSQWPLREPEEEPNAFEVIAEQQNLVREGKGKTMTPTAP